MRGFSKLQVGVPCTSVPVLDFSYRWLFRILTCIRYVRMYVCTSVFREV